jgi:hypothetical protein
VSGAPRANDNDSNSSGLPQKRGRPCTSWDLEAEGSAEDSSYVCHQGPARDIKCIYDGTKQSGEAHPMPAQRLHSHPVLGHGALQEMLGPPEQEQSKGRAQLGMQHDSHSIQQIEQQYEESAEVREGHAIPRTLTKRQRLMLWTNVESGVIKCKLCPTVELSSWQCFRRHCDTSEDHPAELTFCDRCGDYFGRRDSERRHKLTRKYQEERHTTPRDQAKRKKKTVEWIFKHFNARMEHCLRTGEELGPRFAAMTAQAKVPNASKKVWLEGNS